MQTRHDPLPCGVSDLLNPDRRARHDSQSKVGEFFVDWLSVRPASFHTSLPYREEKSQLESGDQLVSLGKLFGIEPVANFLAFFRRDFR